MRWSEIMVLPSSRYVLTISVQLSTLLLLLVLCVMRLQTTGVNGNMWQGSNCRLLGHERMVKIENCVPFKAVTNACRGYCLSYAHPTPFESLTETNKLITSKGECCNIGLTRDWTYSVLCNSRNGIIRRNVTFKSALSCQCSACQTFGSSFDEN